MSPSSAGSGLDAKPLIWLDGRLVARDEPALRADDSAYATGLGVYTSARVTAGVARHARRHASRLARDAAALGLGRVDPERCLEAMARLSEATFGAGSGIVRLQASRDGSGRTVLCGVTRPLGALGAAWSAVVSDVAHPGPAPWGGAKVTGHLHPLFARDAAGATGADEALLFDVAGRLVEGARTNLVARLADGALATPPAARGGVAGIALEIVRESVPELVERDLGRDALSEVRELVALNAVRGAVAIVRLDGRAVGDGAPGPLARRLAALVDAAA